MNVKVSNDHHKPTPGHFFIRVNVVSTVIFAISAGVAAMVFDGISKVQGVAVAMVLFAAGVVAFIWGYWTAVQRSRTHEMSVAELYFLLGAPTPKGVKRVMNGCLIAQCAIALVTALARGSTPSAGVEGGSSPGSTLAFGVLVPLFGLGLNGLWTATYAEFPRRATA
jgi:hypothetical protein